MAAEATRSSLGSAGPLRIEFGGGTSPDVGAGNDFLVAMPVDLFGKTRAAKSSGEAAVMAAKAALKQAQLDVQADVVNAFADAQSAQTLLETGRSIEEIDQIAYDATKKRIDAGDLPPAQLLRADLELQRAKQALELRSQSLAASKIRLASTMGVAASDIRELETKLPDPPAPPRLEERADLAQMRSDAASAAADARIASASRWPDLEVQFARSPFDSPEQYNARIQVVLPLYDFGASREKIRAAHLSRQAADRSIADRLRTARSEIEATKLELESSKAASLGYERLTNDGKTLVQKEQRGFAAGASSLLDVLEATRALRDIEESAADARTKWIQAEGRYLSAIGALLVRPS